MKLKAFVLASFMFAGAPILFSQTSCDSMFVDTVYVDQQSLQLTVYNSSQHFIVYPFFSVSLDQNPYIQLGDTLIVPSFLSITSDINGGYTPAFFHNATIAPAASIPFQTLFTGTLTIRDPNDSTFSCSQPFSFLFGEMITSSTNAYDEKFQFFPNPTNGKLYISLPVEHAELIITDSQGKRILHQTVTERAVTLDLQDYGVFFITVISSFGASTQKLLVHR